MKSGKKEERREKKTKDLSGFVCHYYVVLLHIVYIPSFIMSILSRSSRVLSSSFRPLNAAASTLSSTRSFASSSSSSYNSNSSSSSSSRDFGFGAGIGIGAALLLGGTSVALCADNKSAAAPCSPCASVDYAAVRKSIASLLEAENYDDGSRGPFFLRLAWHASGTYDKNTGTGGSCGGTIRFHPEASHGANAGLGEARAKLEEVKKKFPAISYGDLYTLAGVVAIEEMGGPVIPWRSGRVDKPDGSHCTPDGRLPDAAQGAHHVRDIFNRMGFNDREIVALIGAHSVGRCHPSRSGFDGPWTRAPTTISNEFYRVLLDEKWVERIWKGPKQYTNEKGKDLMMLPADLAFIQDEKFKPIVMEYAADEAKWRKDFSAAVSKLFELGVKFPKPWYQFW